MRAAGSRLPATQRRRGWIFAVAISLLPASNATPGQGASRDRERLLPTAIIESLAIERSPVAGAMAVRITHPAARGRFPVVLLSQGARSTPAMYAPLAQHWAARGYVVLHPIPSELSPIAADATTDASPRLPASVQARIGDIHLVLRELGRIEVRAGVLRGRLDRERVAIAGHSIGALASLLAVRPDLGIDAVLLIGNPGRSGIVSQDGWRALRVAALLVTGTHDDAEIAAGGTRPAAVFALDAQPAATPLHELFVRGMDVCLGGLLCRMPPGTTADPAALSAVAEVSTAFLRAYLREEADAAEWLAGEAPAALANGRASLKVHR